MSWMQEQYGYKKTVMNIQDKRVKKTIKNIRGAFLQLLREKSYREIKVQDICALAECSRNTFYMYYTYKDDLYEQVMDDCIQSITEGFRSIGSISSGRDEYKIEDYVDNFLSAIEKNSALLLTLTNADQSGAFIQRLSNAIYNVLLSESISTGYGDTGQYRLICVYTAYGFVAFSMRWLCEENRISLEEAKSVLHTILESSMIHGIEYA